MTIEQKLILLYLENRRENIGLRMQLANDREAVMQSHEDGRGKELDIIIRALKEVFDG